MLRNSAVLQPHRAHACVLCVYVCSVGSRGRVEKARRIANVEEMKAVLVIRLQKELRLRPHEAVASAKRILALPDAASIDAAVSCRCYHITGVPVTVADTVTDIPVGTDT